MTLNDEPIRKLTDAQRRRVERLLDENEFFFEDEDDGWISVVLYDGKAVRVALGEDDGRLLFKCSCDEFRKAPSQPCVHITAALSAADDGGWLDVDELTFDSGPSEEPKANSHWKTTVSRLRDAGRQSSTPLNANWPQGRELLYVIDLAATFAGEGIVVETMHRDRKRDGAWGKLHPSPISRRLADTFPDLADREICSMLIGANAGGFYYDGYNSALRHLLSPALSRTLVPLMCRTGRCVIHSDEPDAQPTPMRWDERGAWQLHLAVTPDPTSGDYVLQGELVRGDEHMPLDEPLLLTAGGLVFRSAEIAPLDDAGAFEWVTMLREKNALHVPKEEGPELVAELNRLPRLPRLRLPEDLSVEEIQPPCRPRLRLRAPTRGHADERLRGELSFEYDGVVVQATDVSRGIFEGERRRLIIRDGAAEAAAAERLRALGFRFDYDSEASALMPRLPTKNLPRVVKSLLLENWHVEADGKLYRRAGTFKVEVTSGIDWFDLSAKVDFEGQSASLPALLAALRRGETVVRLDDGTFGLLPEEWLAKYAPLASVAKAEDEMLRFSRTQVGLLDALLATQEDSTFDETFRRTRDELKSFEGIVAADPPASFIGELRPYQRDTLGWFDFLRRFGFGGCLADDMGLGKTVQVLALLESRRVQQKGPALVVVPRSLIFNWKQEAARFTPQLRVLDHSGIDRLKSGDHFSNYDLVLTTYGTLRRDVPHLKDTAFDYVVLDEAQAIKNPNSESAKAARLLRAEHRLVLSGTPVQNHLGDLWSLFEFLNPGMLGAVTAFNTATAAPGGPDQDARVLLARGLRPFILRRTKDQVATELPSRLEQTIYCEMETEQRKLYDDLREHYRQSLLGLIDREGINKAKIQILEALLRLRQAACHPGLIDKMRDGDASAKLDMLVPRLAEVTEEGHKALIFSQFTQFLAILRKKLDRDNIPYEYLDGRTRDREERVNHFQNDPNCKLFLISLKAGGLGLNLTAADYVFLLDPWWNPAVEAQAIDRSHRIGQTRQVFACRLIAKGTVEEKVLALQQSKRALADAIINADNSLIRTIGREDLQLLLS